MADMSSNDRVEIRSMVMGRLKRFATINRGRAGIISVLPLPHILM